MYQSNNSPAPTLTEQKITSVEIAELANKNHSDLLRSIRRQEVAWLKVGQSKFTLSSYKNSQNKNQPMFELTKADSLYVSSKFNDEIRAKLVSRWMELESKLQKKKGFPKLPPKRNHNRLTATRLLDLMVDVAMIEDKALRLSLTKKLGL